MSTVAEVFQSEEVVRNSSTARKINNLLNSSETRMEGLQLLNYFLQQCSDEDFLQFCISWMQNCCKADVLTKNRHHAIRLLSKLFQISSSYRELKKSVSFFITTRYFDYFFKYLVNSQEGWCCTESCLSLYKGACAPFQVTLENHLKNELKKDSKISLTIGGCLALIPCIGGGGNEGENYVKNWKTQFVHFLNTCCFILNDLFVTVEEYQEYENLEHLSNDNEREKSVEQLTTWLINHLIVINCMLLNKYPAPKNVPCDLIFQLICKGLSLNLKVLAKHKTATIISLEKVLPEIKCTFLSLLKALIVTCKNQLLPYSRLICKLIKQVLEWTKNDFTSGNYRFSHFRILAYETLCDWLAAAKSGSCVEFVSGAVISNAINDIRSKKKYISLKETRPQNRLKGRERATPLLDVSANRRLCLAALKTLQILLKFAGAFFKPEEHKFLQEIVVELVTKLQKNSFLVPFDVPACRAELYGLLLELVFQPCPVWPPPTNYALRLFREGINDSSSKVSSFCSSGLNFVAVIIHPQYDNGGFPLCETSSASKNRSRTEARLQWSDRQELGEVGKKIGQITLQRSEKDEKRCFNSDSTDKPEKLNGSNDDSDISSDEDSRSTVQFLESPVEPNKTDLGLTQALTRVFNDNNHPHPKRQRISKEEHTEEKVPLPVKELQTEIGSIQGASEKDKMEKLGESSYLDKDINSKSSSPESMIGEGSKARYYLRSKKKGSSEEPEEAAKKTSSPESLKNTPTKSLAKNTPIAQKVKERPRTRARSRIVTNSESEVKTLEDDERDEEGLKAAFDDSFVD